MTVIAWDGTTLAADRRATVYGYPHSVQKIYRINDMLVGACGDAGRCKALLAWVRSGCVPDAFPPKPHKEDDDCELMVIHSATGIYRGQSRIHMYDTTGHPAQVLEKYHAIGSGRHHALAAMYLGHTAVDAVHVACTLHIQCGNGIDSIDFTQHSVHPALRYTPTPLPSRQKLPGDDT